MVRTTFERQLENLDDVVQDLADLVERAFSEAHAMVNTGDAPDAQMLYNLLSDIGGHEREAETQCMRILLRQQPVASDLRETTGAMRMASELKRIGDQSYELCQCLSELDVNDTRLREDALVEMAECAQSMVTRAIDSYLEHDAGEAEAAAAMDDTVDAAFRHAQRLLIDALRAEAVDASHAVSLLMAAKYLERICDHAERICGWTVYVVRGIEPTK